MNPAFDKYQTAETEYLKKYGQDSLDRVLLMDPIHMDDELIAEKQYEDAAVILNKAIKDEEPLEQIPEEQWNQMIF